MINLFVFSFGMALVWMVLSGQASLEGLVLGYILGFAILLGLRLNTRFAEEEEPLQLRRLPSQFIWLVLYIFRLAWDVFKSGVDVARRVIQPEMPINPGVHCISIQDEKNNAFIGAMSAHGITITPGELVIDFDECGDGTMLVHAIDKEASSADKLKSDQADRVKVIKRILGYDE